MGDATVQCLLYNNRRFAECNEAETEHSTTIFIFQKR